MNVQCHSCIGGTSLGEDIRKLDYGQHVVSGTPGRVFGESSSTESLDRNPESLSQLVVGSQELTSVMLFMLLSLVFCTG